MTTHLRDECDLLRDGDLSPDPFEGTQVLSTRESGFETSGSEKEWAPPIPFDDVDPDPFPLDVLPGWLRQWVDAVEEALQVPPDFPAMLGLGLVASAGAGRIRVRVDAKHTEPVNLYIVIVGAPSVRKSPSFSLAQEPLLDHERALREGAKPRIRDAAIRRKLAEKRLADVEQRAAKSKTEEQRQDAAAEVRSLTQDLEEMEVPHEPRLFESNVTPEALVSALAEQNGRIVALSSEGHDFIETACGMRYSDQPNLEVLLKSWSGDSIRVSRKGRETEDITSPALTIVVAVQPMAIQGLLKRPGVRQRGLPARLLCALPTTNQGRRKSLGRHASMDEELQRRYVADMRCLFEGLDSLPKDEPCSLELSPEAFEVLADFDSECEQRLHPETGDLAWMDDWAGKWTGTVARLAGVLHLADDPADRAPHARQVTRGTMERAVALGRYLGHHAMIAYGLMGANPAVETSKRVVSVMRRHPFKQISRSELYQALRRRGGVGKPRDLEEPLELVEEHGYARQVPPENGDRRLGRPPTPIYEISPWIHGGLIRPNKPRSGSGAADC